MTPDVSAQIVAKAWLDDTFAQALRGPAPFVAIEDALGVSVPPGTPLPEIPPRPDGATAEALDTFSQLQARTLTIICLLSLSLLCGHPVPTDPEDPVDPEDEGSDG